MRARLFLFAYPLFLVFTLLALLVIKYFNLSYPLEITSRTTSGELAVVGEGKVDAVPDTATVTAGITVSNVSSVAQAQQQITKVNNAVISAVEGVGIRKEDITTSSFSITPSYSYDLGFNKITGYNGNATISIKVRNINGAPQVITLATENGANQVGDVQYSIEHPETYREKAREKAIANAKEQAQKLASELGIKLGSITNFVENNNQPVVQPLIRAQSATGGSPEQPIIEQGTQTVTSEVTLYFDKR